MRLLLALIASPAFAGCLVMDSLILQTPPLCPGTCEVRESTGNVKGLFVPQFIGIGHNSCKSAKTGQGPTGSSVVTVAFYDKEGYRLGVGSIYIAPLDPGEKFKHLYEVPSDVNAVGPATVIKVKTVEDTSK